MRYDENCERLKAEQLERERRRQEEWEQKVEDRRLAIFAAVVFGFGLIVVGMYIVAACRWW